MNLERFEFESQDFLPFIEKFTDTLEIISPASDIYGQNYKIYASNDRPFSSQGRMIRNYSSGDGYEVVNGMRYHWYAFSHVNNHSQIYITLRKQQTTPPPDIDLDWL